MKKYAILAGMALDASTSALAVLTAVWLKFSSGIFPGTSSLSASMVAAGCLFAVFYWAAIFSLSGCYTLHWDRSWTDELRLVFKPVTVGILLLLAISFAASPGMSPGRSILFIYFFIMLVLTIVSRSIARLFERRLSRLGRLTRVAVIVGTGRKAADLAAHLESSPALGYRISGFVSPSDPSRDSVVAEERIIGTVADLPRLLRRGEADELLVTIASNFHEDILSLLLPATSSNIRVKVVPDLFDIVAGHVHNTQILGEQLMEILPERLSFLQKLVKTAIDYALSLTVLAAGLPVWILLAAAIRLDSRGPVFYRQKRVGRGGRIFRIFKFRSMVADAEKHSGPVWAGRDDPRITRVGAFLRKTRLDEIPQFINVLRGEMSVVGPRPERPRFVEELRRVYPFYDKRLTVKPGITGWAQVKLEYDTSIEDVADKLKLDFYYIENMSLFLDLEILARTVFVVLTGRGAH